MDPSTFQYVTEPSKDITCSICLKPWYDPTETPCEHIFCTNCITAAIRRNPSCPDCRLAIPAGTVLRRSTRVIRNQVDGLVMYCTAKEQGCAWQGPRGDFDAHFVTCNCQPKRPDGPMTIAIASEYDQYAFHAEATVLTMLHLAAPTLPTEMLEAARKPIHVCAVLDRSGSMGGEKMTLLKDTMRFVISELNDKDTLSIVTYNHAGRLTLPDTKMNEAGKRAATEAVESVMADGNTNISDAFFLGMEQFGFARLQGTGTPPPEMQMQSNVPQGHRRRSVTPPPPPVFAPRIESSTPPPAKSLDDDTRSVWILTDGEANGGIQEPFRFTTAMKGIMGDRKDVSVYTFGFGTPHNEELLSAISEAGGGMYYFIKSLDSVKTSFADCLGGLMSQVVRDVEITVTVPTGVTLLRMLGQDNAVVGSKARMSIRDLSSEEKRDIVVEVKLEAGSAPVESVPIVTWNVAYTSVLDSTKWTSSHVATVSRPATVSPAATPNTAVAEQRARIEVMSALEEASALCAKGNFAEAQSRVTRASEFTMQANCVSSPALMQKCARAKASCISAVDYEREGKYAMKSMAMEQRHQRTASPGEDGEEGMYSNQMKSACRSRATPKPTPK